jgi:hypothetical protein
MPTMTRRGRCAAALAGACVFFALTLASWAPAAGATPPSKCWVGWRPSQGSISWATDGRHITIETIKLAWRSEDLTFRSCRSRTAFELETTFGTSNGRHKLGTAWSIDSSDLPGTYKDSEQTSDQATVGFGNADLIQAGHTYTIKVAFPNHLGPSEFFDVVSSRNYRLSPCVGGYAICVNGWTDSARYGPSDRLPIFLHRSIAEGKTYSWSYPSRSTLRNEIIRDPTAHDAYTVDSSYIKHWIRDGGTYNCLVGQGWRVVNAFADIPQRWVINSFETGGNATCSAGPPPASNGGGDGGGSTPGSMPTVSLAQGPAAPAGFRYAITLSGYAPNTSVAIKCYDTVSPGGFYPFSLTTDAGGSASTANYCYSADGPDHWVIAGGVESNHVTWGTGSEASPGGGGSTTPQPTWSEQETPNHPVNTFTNYHNASGLGPAITAGQWVSVSCKVYDSTIQSVNPDGYWYRIASSPWNNAYYAPANTFMNGDPYGGPYTHNTDFSVGDC